VNAYASCNYPMATTSSSNDRFLVGILLGMFLGIMMTGWLALLLNMSSGHYQTEIAVMKARHEQETGDMRKRFMVDMVRHGAAEWTVSNDGRTTWTEKALSNERKILK
jgi:hypothetical protein